MAAVNHRRLWWMAQRAWLRHGASALLAACGGLVLVVLAIGVATRTVQLSLAEDALAERLLEARATLGPVAEEQLSLPLPEDEARFDITRAVLQRLSEAGLEPERVRYTYESVEQAGLVRQIGSFTLKARWGEIAALLADLQRVDRSVYIAKLKVVSERPDDEQVVAEVQLAWALLQHADTAESRQ